MSFITEIDAETRFEKRIRSARLFPLFALRIRRENVKVEDAAFGKVDFFDKSRVDKRLKTRSELRFGQLHAVTSAVRDELREADRTKPPRLLA